MKLKRKQFRVILKKTTKEKNCSSCRYYHEVEDCVRRALITRLKYNPKRYCSKDTWRSKKRKDLKYIVCKLWSNNIKL